MTEKEVTETEKRNILRAKLREHMDEIKQVTLTPFGEFARAARQEAFLVFPGIGNDEYRLRYFEEVLRGETARIDRVEWMNLQKEDGHAAEDA